MFSGYYKPFYIYWNIIICKIRINANYMTKSPKEYDELVIYNILAGLISPCMHFYYYNLYPTSIILINKS